MLKIVFGLVRGAWNAGNAASLTLQRTLAIGLRPIKRCLTQLRIAP